MTFFHFRVAQLFHFMDMDPKNHRFEPPRWLKLFPTALHWFRSPPGYLSIGNKDMASDKVLTMEEVAKHNTKERERGPFFFVFCGPFCLFFCLENLGNWVKQYEKKVQHGELILKKTCQKGDLVERFDNRKTAGWCSMARLGKKDHSSSRHIWFNQFSNDLNQFWYPLLLDIICKVFYRTNGHNFFSIYLLLKKQLRHSFQHFIHLNKPMNCIIQIQNTQCSQVFSLNKEYIYPIVLFVSLFVDCLLFIVCPCRFSSQAGKAYDLTKFAKVHPGGAKLITDAAGMDATAIFDPIHPKENGVGVGRVGSCFGWVEDWCFGSWKFKMNQTSVSRDLGVILLRSETWCWRTFWVHFEDICHNSERMCCILVPALRFFQAK